MLALLIGLIFFITRNIPKTKPDQVCPHPALQCDMPGNGRGRKITRVSAGFVFKIRYDAIVPGCKVFKFKLTIFIGLMSFQHILTTAAKVKANRNVGNTGFFFTAAAVVNIEIYATGNRCRFRLFNGRAGRNSQWQYAWELE